MGQYILGMVNCLTGENRGYLGLLIYIDFGKIQVFGTGVFVLQILNIGYKFVLQTVSFVLQTGGNFPNFVLQIAI